MKAGNMLIAAAVALALAQPVFAKRDRDDDDDRGHPGKGWAKGWDKKGGSSGPYTHFENSAERYRYEFRDARCRYKYEYHYRSGKSKVEQRGDCSGIAFPQRVVMQGREPLPRAIPPEPEARSIECNREVIGAVLGGAVGAMVGNKVGQRSGASEDERFVTTVGGAVIGAVVGGSIGKSMDDADHACAAQAMEYANFKQSVRWSNPQRGAVYTMTPIGIVPAAGRALECRRYSMLTEQRGHRETTQGTACRQRDGSWRLSS